MLEERGVAHGFECSAYTKVQGQGSLIQPSFPQQVYPRGIEHIHTSLQYTNVFILAMSNYDDN